MSRTCYEHIVGSCNFCGGSLVAATQQLNNPQNNESASEADSQTPTQAIGMGPNEISRRMSVRSNTQTVIRGSSFCAGLPVTSASKILKELYLNISYSVFKYIIVQQARCQLCIVSHHSTSATGCTNTAGETSATPVQRTTVAHVPSRPEFTVAVKSFPHCCVYCLFRRAQNWNTTHHQQQQQQMKHTTTGRKKPPHKH